MLNRVQFFEVLNKGLHFFSEGNFESEFTSSKADFFENSSILDEQSPTYGIRVEQFLDWYFFSRPLNDFRLPPSHCVFMRPDLRWAGGEAEMAGFLKEVKHSLYEVLKVKGSSLYLIDLFSKEKIESDVGVQSILFQKGQVFDGRMLSRQKDNLLLKGKCFHPEEAIGFLKDEIKIYQKDKDLDRERFLLATLKMRYLSERYPHARMDQIYSWKNRWIENEFS